MTTPREHADAAIRYFSDSTLKCWARDMGSDKDWTQLSAPNFYSNTLEYYVGHEPPPPDKRTITLTVNGREWELPEPLTDDAPRNFYYVSETNDAQVGFKGVDCDDNLLADIRMNGGGVYATKADAQAWADFNKWCLGGGV